MQGCVVGRLKLTIAGREFLIGGDIVTSMNDQRLEDLEKLSNAMQALQVGATVRIKVFRDGKELDIRYVLPERPILPGDVRGDGMLAPLTDRVIQRSVRGNFRSRVR
jgi:S1-C subfamily serine protease